MADYAKTTWVENVTKVGPTNMNKLEEGVRIGGKRAVLNADGATAEERQVEWRRGPGGALIAYSGRLDSTGAAPNRNVMQEDWLTGEGTGFGRRFIRAQQESGGRATVQITAIGSAPAGGREVKVICESADGFTFQEVVVLNDLGTSDFSRDAQPRARASRAVTTAAFNGSGSNPTVLTYNTENYDTNNIVDLVSSTSRFTCRTAGLYLFHADLQPNSAPPGGYRIVFRINGVATYYGSGFGNIASFWESSTASAQLLLNVNDYVEVCGFNSNATGFQYSIQTYAVRLSA